MLFIRTPSTLAREVMKAKKGTPFLRSLFFATPNEPREWLRGKDLSVRRLCDGKRSYKKINTYAYFVAERYICCSSVPPQPWRAK